VGDDQAQEGGRDAKRSKVFAKLIKNIEVAARLGGGDWRSSWPCRSRR